MQGYLKAQQLGYKCALAIEKELKEGMTEIQVAKLLNTYLRDHGVKSFLHRPFAWFGERTRFQNFKKYGQFLPTKRRLRPDDVVILDVAPILNGYMADIGYTTSMIPHAGLYTARKVLRELRGILPLLFESSTSSSDIWHIIDQRIKEHGFDNCYKQYPFSVLGHRLYQTKWQRLPNLILPFGMASWFNFFAGMKIVQNGFTSELLGPKHKGSKLGLWAIEPHLGGNGFGAKFEEILVVEEKNVYWLDPKTPHHCCA